MLRLHAARRAAAALVTVVLMLTAAGCGGDPGPGRSAQAPVEVTYLTSFGGFGRDAYVFLARDKGFFREVGIEVNIQLGQATGNLVAIAADRADFCAVDSAGAMIAYAQGNHEFRLVAAIHQQTLAAIMTVEGRGITVPKDLAGKVVADQASSVVKMLWPTYARLAGVDPNSVRWQGAQASDLPVVLGARRADAIGQFVVGVPTIEAVTKGKAVVLPYSDYLRDLFGIALAVRADLVTDRPDLVKRFRSALLKGLDYSLAHPEEAAAALKAAQPAVVAGPAAAELRLMAPYVRAGTTEIGAFDASRVARAIAIMAGSGAIPVGSIEPEGIVAFDLAPGAATK